MMNENCIIVDENDKITGQDSKINCHLGNGKLHRAFSVLIFNSNEKLLIQQIYSSVKWRESLINMSNSGVKNFIEIGPGKALSGMVKRTVKNAKSFSINTITDMKNLENEFKK